MKRSNLRKKNNMRLIAASLAFIMTMLQFTACGEVKEDVPELVKNRDFDVLIILGAGDLDNYMEELAEIIKSKE